MWREYLSLAIIFFFQAEDGIRDIGVTGVQTCALPISQLQPASLGKPCTTTKTKATACSLLRAGEGRTPPRTAQPRETPLRLPPPDWAAGLLAAARWCWTRACRAERAGLPEIGRAHV